MNLLTNPGLELALPPPTLSADGAFIVSEQAHTGALSAKLQLYKIGADPDPVIKVGGFVIWPLALIPGQIYPVQAWCYGNLRLGTALTLAIDPGSGLATILWTLPNPPSGWFLWAPGSFAATGPVGAAKWQVGVAGTVGGTWYLDDANVESIASEVLMLEQIGANLLTKLQAINGAGAYLTTPKVVRRGWQRVDRIEGYPAIFLRQPSVSSADSPGVPYRQVVRIARWPLIWFVKDEEDDFDQIVNVARDIVTAIETDQTLGGLGYMSDRSGRAILVEETEPLDVDAAVARGIQGCGALVRTTYFAPQGVL